MRRRRSPSTRPAAGPAPPPAQPHPPKPYLTPARAAAPVAAGVAGRSSSLQAEHLCKRHAGADAILGGGLGRRDAQRGVRRDEQHGEKDRTRERAQGARVDDRHVRRQRQQQSQRRQQAVVALPCSSPVAPGVSLPDTLPLDNAGHTTFSATAALQAGHTAIGKSQIDTKAAHVLPSITPT